MLQFCRKLCPPEIILTDGKYLRILKNKTISKLQLLTDTILKVFPVAKYFKILSYRRAPVGKIKSFVE